MVAKDRFHDAKARQMTDMEAAWLAGLMEGEGSFLLLNRRTDQHPTPRLSLMMTDRDVLEKVVAITGCGRVRDVGESDRLGSKPMFTWQFSRMRDVAILCEAMLPHLCVRRRQAAQSILDLYEARLGASHRKESLV